MTKERYPLALDDLLDIALRGWALHPLIPGTKQPATANGFKDATTDLDQIREWHEARPDLGWGTPTGTVADIDRPDQMILELPETVTQDTPSGGRHILMAPTDRRLPGKLPGEAGEWRADGKAYVKIYDPQPFLDWRPEECPEVPEEAFTVSEGGGVPTTEEPLSLTTREEIIALAGRLRADGLDPEDIYQLLVSMKDDGRIYDTDRDDPWEGHHFHQIAREAGKWKRGEVIGAPRIRRPEGDEPVRFMEFLPLSEVEESEPEPLLLDRLHPQELTILFGDGGTGKGVLAAWWVARMAKDHEMRILVVDYEQHTRYEWRPRVRRFAGEDQDKVLANVFVVQPDKPIWLAAPTIRQFCDQEEIDYVVVDSILYAVGDQEAEKSGTAIKVTSAYQEIGRPMLALAHTTKADADPRHPFGSVFWSNSARVTMSFVGQGDAPRILTMKKTNQKMAFSQMEYEWSWTATANEPPETLDEKEHSVSHIDAFVRVIGREWVSLAAAVDALADAGYETTEPSLRSQLAREVKKASRPRVEKKVEGVGTTWRATGIDVRHATGRNG